MGADQAETAGTTGKAGVLVTPLTPMETPEVILRELDLLRRSIRKGMDPDMRDLFDAIRDGGGLEAEPYAGIRETWQ